VLEGHPVRFQLDFASERLGLGGQAGDRRHTRSVRREKRHAWGEPLSARAELEAHLDGRLAELGPGDIDACDPDPVLLVTRFGACGSKRPGRPLLPRSNALSAAIIFIILLCHKLLIVTA